MQEFEYIYNYRYVDESLATSGQPSVAQLQSIAKAGFTTVINLALHDDPRYSLPDEAAAVSAVGLEYVYIPVKFDAPTLQNLVEFFDAMDYYQGRKVWVHCVANKRVSVFVGLYQILRNGWEEVHAFELMRSLWQPNEVWASFISAALRKKCS